MISCSFLTDVSNFEEFDSSHSEDDPLTSTPIKTPDRREQSSLYISPVPPTFIPADESSIISDNDSFRFDESDNYTSTPAATSKEPAKSSSKQITSSKGVNIASEEHANINSIQVSAPTEGASRISLDTALATDPANHGSTSSQWFGYKVVGDNVDKKVKPRHMRSDNQSKDLHYFHLYAAKDRIDFSEASEEPPSLNPDAILSELLPTADDIKDITSNFGVLISRKLIQYFPYFEKHFSDIVTQHIPHAHEEEMKKVSKVVSVINTHVYTLLKINYIEWIITYSCNAGPIGCFKQKRNEVR